ncbi:hypothetical protein PRIC2_010506 [Phytophthora ramorum]
MLLRGSARPALRRGFAKKAATDNLQERLVALCRHRGFVFPGSELYGGLANSFDYGPLGVLMKKNVMDRWWFEFVQKTPQLRGAGQLRAA